MGGQDKQANEDPTVLTKLKKEIEKKQVALVKAERARSLLKRKVDELTTTHACMREEFHATFDGLNAEKGKLATTIEEQNKIILGLIKCEPLRIKKIQKYIKYFLDVDQDKELDLKKMVEQREHLRKQLIMKAKGEADQLRIPPKENENGAYSRKEKQNESRLICAFQLLLERYIEQSQVKEKQAAVLRKEANELPYKDLKIWNYKQELKKDDENIAKLEVELSSVKACLEFETKRRQATHEAMEGLLLRQGEHIEQLTVLFKLLQEDDPMLKRNIDKRRAANQGSAKQAKIVHSHIHNICDSSLDDNMSDLVMQTKELICLYEEKHLTNKRLFKRVQQLENYCSLGKDEDPKSPTPNIEEKLKSRSFFDRFRRKKKTT